MKRISRPAVLASVVVLLFALLHTHWTEVRWGTAPEWVGAVALLSIAAGVWRIASTRGLQAHAHPEQSAEHGDRHS